MLHLGLDLVVMTAFQTVTEILSIVSTSVHQCAMALEQGNSYPSRDMAASTLVSDCRARVGDMVNIRADCTA